jgi:uncharacterized protein YxeA
MTVYKKGGEENNIYYMIENVYGKATIYIKIKQKPKYIYLPGTLQHT